MKNDRTLIIGLENVTVDHLIDAVYGNWKVELSQDDKFISKINKSRAVFEKKLNGGETIYGVTTGYGDSCSVEIPRELTAKLPLQLTRYHQCGMGENFNENETKLIQLSRIISLAQGYSAVRMELLEHMVKLYNLGLTARIPKEGSVGASGDLTPLAYYAATLLGEGEFLFEGEFVPSTEVYEKLNIEPLVLAEKEALALMNGTAVMTGIACLVYRKASYLCELSSRITAVTSLSLLANSHHFDEEIFKAKPHVGSQISAKWMRKDLASAFDSNTLARLQDRYSVRCAPQIIGVLVDALEAFKPIIEREINSANDNPLIDGENERVLHGGNFYGGHIAFVMDSLKILIANIADLMDRQIALLVDTKFNNGLPANLSSAKGDEKFLCHGLKALQISSSAWTAEALKNTLAASIFSRSTECHNQDKVSMGTISARDAMRVLELTNQVAAAALITGNQALEIRKIRGEVTDSRIGKNLSQLHAEIREDVAFVENDRALESEIRTVYQKVADRYEGYQQC